MKRIKQRTPTRLEKARLRGAIDNAVVQTHKHFARRYAAKAFVWGFAFGAFFVILLWVAKEVWF